MKILQIIPTLDRSGAEKQMTLLACGLAKEEFEVGVCALTRGGPYADDLRNAGIPLTVIGKRRKFSPAAYRRLKSVIRAFRPDIVHTWIFAANAYGRAAAAACGVPKIVCGERCVDPWKERWHLAVDRALAKKTDAIAVNSAGVRDFYSERGIPADLFEIIPNAAAPLPPSCITKEEIFRQLGVRLDGKRRLPYLIGLVARLWPQKRVRDAIWTAEQLKFTELDFHLVIIGDGPERENLLRYRDEIRIHDRVHFIGHRDDVYQFLPHFDLLWSTSGYEGLSNTVMEAMSAGVPVVASDIPGHRELVVPGGTGVLIPEFYGEPIRRRTEFCRESFFLLRPEADETRRRMGAAAKERIAAEFGLSQMLRRYAELYRRLHNQERRCV
ncbi:MAG: glycosyltransferase [Thermoguttaceae bacterium]|nr:glycosyltransferase [Thermoguttaceae bacterium]